ncbi:unnamed protein product [marine sediment metagenome]|uniref:Uncharacterized protein n=1 Tax=marine sediment metagenome TaxID=412755 RepID=X1JAV6_9ZZZZ
MIKQGKTKGVSIEKEYAKRGTIKITKVKEASGEGKASKETHQHNHRAGE